MARDEVVRSSRRAMLRRIDISLLDRAPSIWKGSLTSQVKPRHSTGLDWLRLRQVGGVALSASRTARRLARKHRSGRQQRLAYSTPVDVPETCMESCRQEENLF